MREAKNIYFTCLNFQSNIPFFSIQPRSMNVLDGDELTFDIV